MEQKQEIVYQGDLFYNESKRKAIPLSEDCEAVSGAEAGKVRQAIRAGEQERALVSQLMAVVCSPDNFSRAYKQVKQNKGAAGIDGMLTGEFASWYKREGTKLIESLLQGSYQPEAVRAVEIDKEGGGKRKLGIPTVRDRIIQQAIAQVLEKVYDHTFSESSYGFRPKRGAHQALKAASGYVQDGRRVAVDIDLKNFFDEVNHDRLMSRLSTRISDKPLLKLIRKCLQSGIMEGGITSQRLEGTPQGSPLSPILSNIVLDELDKELEGRGHKFVRYADDCNIYVHSQTAGVRVMERIGNFIETRLKLKINREKSKVCLSNQTRFLGYTISHEGYLLIAEQSLKRLKIKIRTITKRNRGRSMERVIEEVNTVLRGWQQYFKLARAGSHYKSLDRWIRRKLRCYKLKQFKRVITLVRFLRSRGVKESNCWITACSGKGLWRMSMAHSIHEAMNNEWFECIGLYSLKINEVRFKSL